ncbi:MAG: UDP-N-acetylmuramate dehydrogenase [Porticoccaceae bacterium]|jgi:UDP-N-acetylmuramate dehydrogenase|nr:UDP-N-acetylmuramate dehydrogenase [Porticoccaceae bacterium]
MSVIRNNQDLSDANTLAVQSRAASYITVKEMSDLKTARDYLKANPIKTLVLGEGSNLVLGSKLQALVLKIELMGKRIDSEDENQAVVELAAGENWHDSVRWCLDQGFSGIENLALIPGTVGAAPVQNIGAYGVELSGVVQKLEYFDLSSGESILLDGEECGFEYRSSRFKKDLLDRALITRVWLRLKKKAVVGQADYPSLKNHLEEKGLEPTPENIFTAVCEIRRSRLPDPIETPNVGSFFHNPVISTNVFAALREEFPEMPGHRQESGKVKVPAAWLIEASGWKGRELAGVKVSDHHALVLTNPNHCSADEVLNLAAAIQLAVHEMFKIELSIEPRVYLA